MRELDLVECAVQCEERKEKNRKEKGRKKLTPITDVNHSGVPKPLIFVLLLAYWLCINIDVLEILMNLRYILCRPVIKLYDMLYFYSIQYT